MATQTPVKAKPAKAAKPVARAVPKADPTFDPWTVLRFPHLAEKSVRQVEAENRLVFLVERKATKSQVREAVERGFGVAVESVNINISNGQKKASVKLAAGASALDIATRLGML